MRARRSSYTFYFARVGLLAVLLAACSAGSSSNEEPAGIPIGDFTLVTPTVAEATATPTNTPEATPTATAVPEVIQERPLSWFEQNNLLGLAKEADPNVSWTIADCVGYEDDECLTSVNLDPNGDGTKWLVAIPLSAWNPEEYRSNPKHPGRLFGYEGEYTILVNEGLENFQHPGDLVLSDEGWNQYLCMYWNISYPPEAFLFVLLVSNAVAEQYAVVLGPETVPILEARPVTECGG